MPPCTPPPCRYFGPPAVFVPFPAPSSPLEGGRSFPPASINLSGMSSPPSRLPQSSVAPRGSCYHPPPSSFLSLSLVFCGLPLLRLLCPARAFSSLRLLVLRLPPRASSVIARVPQYGPLHTNSSSLSRQPSILRPTPASTTIRNERSSENNVSVYVVLATGRRP